MGSEDKKLSGGKKFRIMVSAVALATIVVRVCFPELADRIDLVTVALLFVAIIPWMTSHVSKISIPGLFEADLRELEKRVDQTEMNAQVASRIALGAQDTAILANVPKRNTSTEEVGNDKTLEELAAKYSRVRSSEASGHARTARLDQIFSEMTNEAIRLGAAWTSRSAWLTSEDPGKQLAAIAHSFAFPEQSTVSEILDVIERCRHPYIQYWALRALHRVVTGDFQISLQDIKRLRDIVVTLRAGTDRHFLASSLIAAIDAR